MKSTDPMEEPRPSTAGPVLADEKTRTLSLDAAQVAQYAQKLRESGKPALRVRETGQAPNRSVVFVAGHEAAAEVLTKEGDFSVCHYAELFGAVSPPGAYLLMRNESAERFLRYKILNAAAVETPWFAWSPDDVKDGPHGPSAITDATRGLARRVVTMLIDAFRCREVAEFDVLGEFGGFAPYLLACEVFGLPGPRACDWFAWLVTQGMTFPKFRPFTPETTPYLNQAAWSQLVLGQLFANFEDRNFALRLLARFAEGRFRAHIRHRLDVAAAAKRAPRRDDLLTAFSVVRCKFPEVSDAEYERHVLYLMLELVGTALAVPSIAFTALIDRAVERPGALLRFTGLKEHVEEQKKTGKKQTSADAYVDEALRRAGATPLVLRNATRKRPFAGGLALDKGEYVCALVSSAELDVPDGRHLSFDRPQSEFLHFGPQGGPHRCFGRPIAMPLLGEMLVGLASLEGLRDARQVTKSIAGVKTRRVVRFDRHTPEAPDRYEAESQTWYYPRRRAAAQETAP